MTNSPSRRTEISSGQNAPGKAKLIPLTLMVSVFLLTACGKATVKPGVTTDGFMLSDLQQGVSAVIVDADVALSDLTPSYQKAYETQFGNGDSVAALITVRLLDSLTKGTPTIRAAAAPALNPCHILHIRNIRLTRITSDVPTALLPTGGQQSLQAAGGGTSESWGVSFDVVVWEPAESMPTENADGEPLMPDSTSGILRYSFRVTSQADVALYAYKSALIEALNVAALKTAIHLRDL